MSDSMDKAVYQAARNGDEAELRRLIERGGSVNWHNPEVRRRMCLAWARSRPVLQPDTAPRHSPTRFFTASSHGAPRRWLRRRPADTRSLAHASSTYGARRPPACSEHVVSSHMIDSGSLINSGTVPQL